jgi:hypothetical protein
MSDNESRFDRAISLIKYDLESASKNGTFRTDKFILDTSRKIGIAIDLTGKLIQKSSLEGKFLEIQTYAQAARMLSSLLSDMFNYTIQKELDSLLESRPSDFS